MSLTLLFSTVAVGSEMNGGFSELLKDMPTKICEIEEYSPPRHSGNAGDAAKWLFKVGTQARGTCFISVKQAQQWQMQQARFVDLRPDKYYGEYRIPGSLNMTSVALRSVPMNKATPLVLLNEGHSIAALESLCADLRQRGYQQVGILDGGIAAWRNRGGAVEGQAARLQDLDGMTAAEFDAERHYGHWVIGEINGPAAGLSQLVKRLSERVTQQRKTTGVEPTLLLVGLDDGWREAALVAAKQAGLPKVFWLQGGKAGIENYLQVRQAMADYVPVSERKKTCKDG